MSNISCYCIPFILSRDGLTSGNCCRMGWEWNLALIPYGSFWREIRRGFHQYFNSTATEGYSAVLEKQQLKFLEALLHRPKDLASLTRLWVPRWYSDCAELNASTARLGLLYSRLYMAFNSRIRRMRICESPRNRWKALRKP